MALMIYLEMLEMWEMWETVTHCNFLNLFPKACSNGWMN